MKRVIYVVVTLGMLSGITMTNFIILKELREFRNEMTAADSIPELEELKYYDEHKLDINDMEELESYKDSLVLFLSNNCSMCDVSKDDVAAFIYYGLANNTNIYFVDIDKNTNIIGESSGPQLKDQKIYATPTMFEIKEDGFNKYEGVDEIYSLLNEYAKK